MRHRLVLAVAALIFIPLGFGVMAKWFFWDEFGVRFNFIAVDYLVYEVFGIGYARFYNMDAYFASNHYQSLDRSQFPEWHRGFGNI